MSHVVLDAAAFDTIDGPKGNDLRDFLARAMRRGGDVWCAAVTIAEVARGAARTRQVEVALSRKRDGRQIRVMDTDESVAKKVGMILHSTNKGSESVADAHVVAACMPADIAVVITSDPDDINELATAVPGTRIVTRRP